MGKTQVPSKSLADVVCYKCGGNHFHTNKDRRTKKVVWVCPGKRASQEVPRAADQKVGDSKQSLVSANHQPGVSSAPARVPYAAVASPVSVQEFKALEARVTALEQENKELKRLLAERSTPAQIPSQESQVEAPAANPPVPPVVPEPPAVPMDLSPISQSSGAVSAPLASPAAQVSVPKTPSLKRKREDDPEEPKERDVKEQSLSSTTTVTAKSPAAPTSPKKAAALSPRAVRAAHKQRMFLYKNIYCHAVSGTRSPVKRKASLLKLKLERVCKAVEAFSKPASPNARSKQTEELEVASAEYHQQCFESLRDGGKKAVLAAIAPLSFEDVALESRKLLVC